MDNIEIKEEMKLLLIFSVLFLGLKAQELVDNEIGKKNFWVLNLKVEDYYDVTDFDPNFLIADDNSFESDEYDFDVSFFFWD